MEKKKIDYKDRASNNNTYITANCNDDEGPKMSLWKSEEICNEFPVNISQSYKNLRQASFTLAIIILPKMFCFECPDLFSIHERISVKTSIQFTSNGPDVTKDNFMSPITQHASSSRK